MESKCSLNYESPPFNTAENIDNQNETKGPENNLFVNSSKCTEGNKSQQTTSGQISSMMSENVGHIVFQKKSRNKKREVVKGGIEKYNTEFKNMANLK